MPESSPVVFSHVATSTSHAKRKKTAAERRAQRLRAEGRMIGKILSSYHELLQHRGSQPSKLHCAMVEALDNQAQGLIAKTFDNLESCDSHISFHNAPDDGAPTQMPQDLFLDLVDRSLHGDDGALVRSDTYFGVATEEGSGCEKVNLSETPDLLAPLQGALEELEAFSKQKQALEIELQACIEMNTHIEKEANVLVNMRHSSPDTDLSSKIDLLYSQALSLGNRKSALASRLEMINTHVDELRARTGRAVSHTFERPEEKKGI